MTELRLKIELNKGRHGIPVERLAKIAEEAEKFFEMFAADMHLGKGEWIADNFKNGSVEYDVRYIGEAPDSLVRVGLKAINHLADPKRVRGGFVIINHLVLGFSSRLAARTHFSFPFSARR